MRFFFRIFLFISLVCLPAFPEEPCLPPAEGGGRKDESTAKNFAIAVGDVIAVDLVFNSIARIFLQEDYAYTDKSTMMANLKSRWVWDEDGYFMNQFGHPYQGSLYFKSGRANGLDFWQSLAVAATGSFLWEEFGETTTPSVNDIITTPVCGMLVGESLHRLYVDASEICPALAWILSPVDAMNEALGRKKASVSGRTEEIDVMFHGGGNFSRTKFFAWGEGNPVRKATLGGALRILYGERCAHSTVEPFDWFEAELDSAFSSHFYRVDFAIDGFLYSRAIYLGGGEATLGLNLLYSGRKSSDAAYSDAATGVKFIFFRPEESSSLRFGAQLDGIFMGTRSLAYLYEDVDIGSYRKNPVRSYDFGYGMLLALDSSAEIGNWLLYSEAEASILFPYPSSELKGSECSSHFLAKGRLGIERALARNFSLGLSVSSVAKSDSYTAVPDTFQFLNCARLYGKFAFRRR